MDAFVQDLRLAVRSWRRRPALTAVVFLTLAMGISATSIVFTIVDAVLLAPLPFPAPDRLAVVRGGLPGQQQAVTQLAGPEVREVIDRARTIAAAGALWTRPAVLGRGESAAEIEVGWSTPGFLEALGVHPLLGRLPSADEHLRTDTVVLGHDLWRRQFGADPAILGQRVEFDDDPRTVVGVMPPAFRMYFPADDGVPESVEAWLPWGGDLRELPRAFRVFTMVARLNDAVGWGTLHADLGGVAAALAREHADYASSGFALTGVPLAEALVAPVRPTLTVLLAVVILLFLVAAANVANLLLIRSSERSTEFAVRLALGAGRWPLWRQFLTEITLLGMAAGVAGVWLAALGVTLLRQLDPAGLPRVHDMAIRGSTLMVSGSTSAAVAFGLGSLAASHAVALARHRPLHHAARVSPRTAAANGLLVVLQVSVSVVLLCGAGLLGRSVAALNAIDPGFHASNVLSVRLSLPDGRYPYRTGGPAIAEFYRQLDLRLAELPGVGAAGATISPPLSGLPLRARPYAYRTTEGEVEWGAVAADYRTVTPGWFRAVGARLVAGRLLDAGDRWDRPVAVVVDSTLAGKAWPGRDPVGEAVRVELFREGLFRPEWGEVVGVVEPIRLNELTGAVREQVYLAHAQAPQRTMHPALRAEGDPRALLPAIRDVVRSLEPDLPVFDVRLMTEYVSAKSAETRVALVGMAIFAGVAVALAAGGVFAALLAAVGRRRREIGIRLALGASPARVFGATLGQGLALTALGVAAGLAMAAGTSRLIAGLLFDVSPFDALTFAAVPAFLAAVAALACSVPAAQAARVDPCRTLRAE
jgi:predicted permease